MFHAQLDIVESDLSDIVRCQKVAQVSSPVDDVECTTTRDEPVTVTVIVMDSQMQSLSEFSSNLWRERELVERVLYRIVQQQLVLEAGQTRWLATSNNEVEAAVGELNLCELLRSAEADALAAELGLGDGPTLRDIAAAVPEPWSSILDEHRSALRDLAAEIQATTEQNRALLGAGARAVRETLLSLSASVATYDSSGVPAEVGGRRTRVDQQA